MSKRAYVLVRKGKVVEIARPLQGSLNIYQPDDGFVKPMLGYKWLGDGVWLASLHFRRAVINVESVGKKPVGVAKKIAELEKKLGVGPKWAKTGLPGVIGFQHRADASASAQHSRRNEAKGLLAWLKKLHGSLSEAVTRFRLAEVKVTGVKMPKSAKAAADQIHTALEAGDQPRANRVWELYVNGGALGEPGMWGYDSRKATVRQTKLDKFGISWRGVNVVAR